MRSRLWNQTTKFLQWCHEACLEDFLDAAPGGILDCHYCRCISEQMLTLQFCSPPHGKKSRVSVWPLRTSFTGIIYVALSADSHLPWCLGGVRHLTPWLKNTDVLERSVGTYLQTFKIQPLLGAFHPRLCNGVVTTPHLRRGAWEAFSAFKVDRQWNMALQYKIRSHLCLPTAGFYQCLFPLLRSVSNHWHLNWNYGFSEGFCIKQNIFLCISCKYIHTSSGS